MTTFKFIWFSNPWGAGSLVANKGSGREVKFMTSELELLMLEPDKAKERVWLALYGDIWTENLTQVKDIVVRENDLTFMFAQKLMIGFG